MAHNTVPLNLPHAGRIAARLCRLLESRPVAARPEFDDIYQAAHAVAVTLAPYAQSDDDPSDAEAEPIRQAAAQQMREFVALLQRTGAGDDRMGQHVRNLFECFAMGEEGAEIALLAGENPYSLQRPV